MVRTDKKRYRRFFAVFFIAMVTFSGVSVLYVHNRSMLEHSQMEHLVTVKSAKVVDVLTKLLYKTQVLSALVIQSDGEVEDFERVATTIVDEPSIRNVLLAPDGIVSDVYPLKGNESVLGLNFFEPGMGNVEAKTAKERGQLVLGGPFDLIQGGQALVGRLPVYLGEGAEKYFWGLVSVTLNYPQALDDAELKQLGPQGFAFEIWRMSPDTGERQMIACSDYQYNRNAPYVEQPMKILNSEWYFRLSPIRNWYQFPETWIFAVASLIGSCLLASLALHNYDLQIIRMELETLTYLDSLTGVLNRRGLLQQIEERTANLNAPFALCYLDLNRFKYINDTYGHSEGDRLLQLFAKTTTGCISSEDLFGRIGGDEFIVLLSGAADETAVNTFARRLQAALHSEIPSERMHGMTVLFSLGSALFPTDALTVDELLNTADHKMYQNKIQDTMDDDYE